MDSWVAVIGVVATFISAIVGAIIMIRKLSPEVSQIQITSANNLVSMAQANAQMSSDLADDLRKRAEAADNRITALSKEIGQYRQEVEQLRLQLMDYNEMKESLKDCHKRIEDVSAERDTLHAENVRLRRAVSRLHQRVRFLEEGREHETDTTGGESL